MNPKTLEALEGLLAWLDKLYTRDVGVVNVQTLIRETKKLRAIIAAERESEAGAWALLERVANLGPYSSYKIEEAAYFPSELRAEIRQALAAKANEGGDHE